MYTMYFKNKDEESFSRVPAPTADVWINVENANQTDLHAISKIIDVDVEDIQDSLDIMEIPRLERIEKDVFVVYTRFPSQGKQGLYTAPLSIILAKEHIVTICPTTCPIIQKILEVPKNLSTQLKSKFLIRILYMIVQEYTRVIKNIRNEVVIHEKDLTSVTDEEITDLTRKEENLNQCLNAISPTKDVIEGILTGKYTIIYEKDQDLLEDLLLASEQSEDLCRLSLRIMSSLRNSVQVVITNQFNKTIRLLTALTIILNFPTTIASLYGMNVSLPLEKNPWAFYIIMFFIVTISVLAFFFFQRRRWL